MKKAIVFIGLFLLVYFVNSQNSIYLNFDILQNNSELVLDSVFVENLNNGSDTMIYNFQSGLGFEMPIGVFPVFAESNELMIKQNYPNPFVHETIIEINSPNESLIVSVYDINGKIVLSEKLNIGKGKKILYLNPGSAGKFIAAFKTNNQEKAIVLTSSASEKTSASVRWQGESSNFIKKMEQNSFFIFNQGDILKFTGFVTACELVQYTSITDSPSVSQTYTFDFTYLQNIQPNSPIIENIEISETSILWEFNSDENTLGYKYNIENNYNTAIDLGETSSLFQDELIPGTHYDFWIWAYNNCGASLPTNLSNSTSALMFSDDENALILSGEDTEAMYILSICDENDTLILRAISTNVNLEDENLMHLIDRMHETVKGKGVGIAAPQIGLNRNIVWVQRHDKGSFFSKPWECYINPRITAYSTEYFLRDDGCLSVGTDCENEYGIVGKSWRANWVEVEYYLPDGSFVQETITHAYTAHIFQHELDHLNGIMFFDRQTEPDED